MSHIQEEVDATPGVDGAGGLRRSAARGGAAVIGSRMVVQLLTVTVTFLVARILSPRDYAIVTCNAVFINLADTLAAAGLGPALVQRPRLREGDLGVGFTLSLGLSAAFCAALFAAAGPLAAYFDYPEMTLVLRVSALTLLLNPFRTVPMALLERRVQLGRHSAIFTASAVVQAAVNLGTAVAGWGYWSLIASYCVSRCLETAAYAWLAGWTPCLRLPGASSLGMVRFGLTVTGSVFLFQIYSQADFAIAAKVAGPVELGYYGLAFQIISMPTTRLAGSFSQVAYTVFCRLHDDRVRILDWYLRLVSLMGAVALPVFGGLALVAGDAVAAVLGAKWAPAVTPLRMLCLPGYVIFVMSTLQPVLNAFGRADLPAKYHATYAAVLPAAFYLLGRRYGLVGICGAWAVCYPLVSVALVQYSRPVLGFGVRELARTQAPGLLAAAVMAAAVLGVQTAIPGAAGVRPRLAAAVAVGASAYAAALWVLARKTVVRDLLLMLREMRGG